MNTIINVIEDDIFNIEGYDAIVNSTNMQLKPAIWDVNSLDKKIHNRAGAGLETECKKIRETGGCDICEATITGAYQLPYKHIIHVVIPDAKKDGASLWEYGQCYYSILSVAMDNGDKKISMPLLGTKRHGYSEKEAAEYAIKSIQEFCRAYPEGLEKITFVIRDNPKLAEYIKELISNVNGAEKNIVSLNCDINNIKLDGMEDIIFEDLDMVEKVAAKTSFKLIKKLNCISLPGILSLIEPIWKVLKQPLKFEKYEKMVLIEKSKVTINIPLGGQEVTICCRQLALRKRGNTMKLVIDIDKINLDVLVDVLADYSFNVESGDRGVKIVNCILKLINASTEGNKKYELIQSLLDWINSTNLINDVIHNVAESEGGKIKELIEAAELEIGEIKLLF